MPIYEYKCKKCNHNFEHLARTMNTADSVPCPKCESPQTQRALSVFAVGAEGSKSPSQAAPGSCRCGGPGPCGMS